MRPHPRATHPQHVQQAHAMLTCWEVGRGHVLHQLPAADVWLAHQRLERSHHLAHVVRRDLGRDADSDALHSAGCGVRERSCDEQPTRSTHRARRSRHSRAHRPAGRPRHATGTALGGTASASRHHTHLCAVDQQVWHLGRQHQRLVLGVWGWCTRAHVCGSRVGCCVRSEDPKVAQQATATPAATAMPRLPAPAHTCEASKVGAKSTVLDCRSSSSMSSAAEASRHSVYLRARQHTRKRGRRTRARHFKHTRHRRSQHPRAFPHPHPHPPQKKPCPPHCCWRVVVERPKVAVTRHLRV
jgi:hypothetical protein